MAGTGNSDLCDCGDDRLPQSEALFLAVFCGHLCAFDTLLLAGNWSADQRRGTLDQREDVGDELAAIPAVGVGKNPRDNGDGIYVYQVRGRGTEIY